MNDTPSGAPLAYSIKEASRATSLGRTRLYQLIAAGRLEAVKMRIPRSSRAAFRFDRARHSEMMARSVPRIVRAAFRNDRAQFEVRGT